MALVEKYHVVAAVHALDSESSDIKEGQLVTLTSSGVKRLTGASQMVLGVAGDTYSQSASAMPGIATGWQNRVSDGFDETKASAKMTVYHSGGEFATDQWQDAGGDLDSAAVGKYLKAHADGVLQLDGVSKSLNSVAVLTRAAGYYPSGVPGTDLNGDIALGGDNSNQYIEFKLLI